MDHISRKLTSFLAIVERQAAADHHLYHNKTTRSEPELAHYRRMLNPVPLIDVALPKLPLVQLKDGQDASQLILLGEVAQQPGTVVVFDAQQATIRLVQTDHLELAPPPVHID